MVPYDEANWVNSDSVNRIFLGDIVTVNYHSVDHSPTSMCVHELFCHCQSDETRFHKNTLNWKLYCRNGSFTGSQFDLSSTFRIAMMYARS